MLVANWILVLKKVLGISYNTDGQQILPFFFSVNQILLLLLVLTVCAILYNKVHQVPSALKNETGK